MMRKFIDIDIDKILAALFAFIVGLLICTVITLCTSCSRKVVYEPVETVRYVDRNNTVMKVDSVFEHDSVLVWIKGDTVVQYKYRDRLRIEYLHDSIYVNNVDSVAVPYTVEVEKRVVPSGMWAALIASLIVIIVLIIGLKLK